MSLCIEEPSCGGVQTRLISKNETECLIKNDNSTGNTTDGNHDNFRLFRMKIQFINNNEFLWIPPIVYLFIAYNSTILIDILPYGRVYESFKLSVYDNISKVWSSEYELKQSIDTRISYLSVFF